GTVALSIGAGSAWLMSSRAVPGRALRRPAIGAGPQSGAAQAVLVGAESVRAFLQSNGVTPAAGNRSAAPTASVLRVICVRK
ncbi:hypothetical protein P3G22_02530, partial [Rhodopseudomonas sp. BAL398]|nr:hypothetical protein [Rhodopseudomonas sp. BAL398]